MRLIVLKNQVPINEVRVDTPDLHEPYEIFVGRSEDCHVLIDDPLISRHHCVFKSDESGWYCHKLSQLGVITVNGAVIDKVKINSGDEIKCGPYSIIVSEIDTKKIQAPTIVDGPLVNLEVNVDKVEDKKPASVSKEELEVNANQLTDNLVVTGSELEGEGISLSEDVGLDEVKAGDESIESDQVEQSDGFNIETDLDSGIISDNANTDFSADENNEIVGEQFDAVPVDEIPQEDNESTRVFKAFVNYQLVLFGEHAPYDRYELEKEEIYIGRDSKKCQIVLNDPEVSTVHAVLRKSNTDVLLEDLNSSNGTILNGERINKAHLSVGDEFVIGSTSFSLEVKSDLLDSESDRLMPVESGQTIETEEVLEEIVDNHEGEAIDFHGTPVVEKSLVKRFKNDPAFRKKVIYAAVGIALVALFIPDEEEKPAKPSENKIAAPVETKKENKKKLSEAQELAVAQAYQQGIDHFEQEKYSEALQEFEKVIRLDDNYKKVQVYKEQTQASIKKLAELEAERRAAIERMKIKKEVEELLAKARDAVKERKVSVFESIASQITEKDPENSDLPQLKDELEAWQKEEERKKFEEAAKIAARKSMVDALAPGKTHFNKKEWYRAILRLEEFLLKKGMDEDLVKEASSMLSESKDNLSEDLGPVLGKARSLKEGQDLKNAYEAFLEVLKIEPTNTEALNEVDDIRHQLETRSKRVYREAIIAESLSLFTDAKEKFQEVQQISPTDSEYYRKASDKLKNYLE